MGPQHRRLHNGISPGEQYNGIRNTNGISWLSLSRAQLISPTDYDSDNPLPPGLCPTAHPADQDPFGSPYLDPQKQETPLHPLIVSSSQQWPE